MSAFLGPIHYWLYNKITLQDKMAEAILDLNQNNNYVQGLRQETDTECDVIEKKPLEEMIDETNIHGWLQHKVNIVERRLAFVVTKILQADAKALEKIEEVIYNLGVQVYEENKDSFESAEQVYQKLNDMLLDGMPCDHVNQMVSSSSDEVVYRRTMCIHETYWTDVNGSIANYYALRSHFIAGYLHDSAFSFTADADGNYHINRK